MKNYDRIWATVDLDAIKHNMAAMKVNLREETKIIAVVKTDGYGHGAVPIAHEIEDLPYLYGFAVATVEEALILRGSGIRKPVLILGYTFPYCYEKMAREEIRPAVFREDMLEEMGKAAVSCGRPVKIHIKVDTGMSRIGLFPDEGSVETVKEIAELPASYQGARNAVSYRVIYGNTRAINIAEIDPQGSAEEPWEEQSIGNILKKIKTGDERTLKEAVKESVTQLSGRGASLQKYQIFITELIAEIFRFGTLNGLNLDEIFGGTGDIYREVMQMESPEALESWLLKTGCQMQEMIQNGRQDTTKSFVTKAIEYVREHYADSSLNVESVCKNLSVSTAYFSTVFKKETGKTFINYLTCISPF